jgi:hypothetical protein
MKVEKRELAEDIFNRLKRAPTPPRAASVGRWKARALSAGWLASCDVEDLLADFDDRLWQVDQRAIADLLRIPVTTLFDRPRSYSSSVMGSDGFLLADLIALLAGFERLGFEVDPAPWVEELRPSLGRKEKLTGAELVVWWFGKTRHKSQSVEIWPDDPKLRMNCRTGEKLVTTTGYKANAHLDADGTVLALSVNAPKYRRRGDPVETVCPDCGHTWYKGDPASSRVHRREHKREMAIRKPAPDPRLLAALGEEAAPEEVLPDSPQWKHDLVYELARRFRREFRYDFVQWSRKDRDADAVAYLFADDTDTFGSGAPVGACAFRRRGGVWTLDWIWVIPAVRRKGILQRRWPSFRERFGEFALEYPLSDAMKRFATKHAPWLRVTIISE